jgi:hypothetical protein
MTEHCMLHTFNYYVKILIVMKISTSTGLITKVIPFLDIFEDFLLLTCSSVTLKFQL